MKRVLMMCFQYSTSLSAKGQDPELCLSTAVNSKDPDSDPVAARKSACQLQSPNPVPALESWILHLEHKVPICQLQEIFQIGLSADIQSGREKPLLS